MTHEHEPGVLYYDFARSVDDPDTYVVIEVYRDVDDSGGTHGVRLGQGIAARQYCA